MTVRQADAPDHDDNREHEQAANRQAHVEGLNCWTILIGAPVAAALAFGLLVASFAFIDLIGRWL